MRGSKGTKRISVTIDAELFERFQDHAIKIGYGNRLDVLFRTAITDYAEYAIGDPISDAKFDALYAQTQADLARAEAAETLKALPPVGPTNWLN